MGAIALEAFSLVELEHNHAMKQNTVVEFFKRYSIISLFIAYNEL